MTRTETYQNRADWLAARRLGVGASDSAALYGESPWQSPLSLYAEKRGLTIREESAVPEFIKWGLKLEPLIASEFGAETGREVIDVPAFTIDRDVDAPMLLATLDRKQRVVDTLAPVGVLELKTTNQFARAIWDEGVPLYYQIQVQHQLMVTGLPFASIAVLIAGAQFFWADVPRNDAFIDDLRMRVMAFWRNVDAAIPPPPDASNATRDALNRMYPVETVGAFVELPDEARDWDEARVNAKETIKEAKEIEADAEAHLKAAIGEHAGGVLPGGTVYTWRAQSRKSHIVKASTFRVLRRKGE